MVAKLPGPPLNVPIAGNQVINPEWARWLSQNLYQRVGSEAGITSTNVLTTTGITVEVVLAYLYSTLSGVAGTVVGLLASFISSSAASEGTGKTRAYKTFTKTAIADNTTTPLCTITSTNEAGDTDGGTYSVVLRLSISHNGTTADGHQAVLFGEYVFSRAMLGTGTGANSGVETVKQTTVVATDAATRSIGTVTVSVTETSEYVQTVNVQIDLTGTSVTTAVVSAYVELLHSGFVTTPVIAAV